MKLNKKIAAVIALGTIATAMPIMAQTSNATITPVKGVEIYNSHDSFKDASSSGSIQIKMNFNTLILNQ